ncbi:nitrite reductase small subunit NirD [Actinopolyspora mortivallis]|uniref:Nitrite reductase (NAD(P)H) small subunit n=1 Tax=Actinopolyspora mortivallis TaxID=33906 RepID=A0A2T0GX87_ACTMO|nr:nitrite reductase small subunit NirD [Actinopolyspora mortivallis]PRW63735.1 nitrite reductase (NAD(P)H) small subunit [Actinopolyspora mortivallis]
MNWHRVCAESALPTEFGMAALVAGHTVALFRTAEDELYAVGNVDPFSGAGVISRGIVGDRAGEPTVASPMHKQVFSLRSGECLDEPARRLPTYPVRRREGVIEIGLS